MKYVVEMQDVVKIYKDGNVKAVDKLNLRIREGEIYGLLGANGSGKTTAINMMNGILYPTSGSIKVMDKEIPRQRHDIAPYIGMAPQEYAVYLDLTVSENIKFYGKLYGIKNSELKERIQQLLKILRLEDKKNTVARKLSGGMKRRVSLACALVHQPRLLYLDESTVGLDPLLRDFFWNYFRSLRDNGVTIIITSHVMDEAEKADRIGLMSKGKLIEEGTPEELKQKYECKTIEEVFIKLLGGEYK